MDCHVAQDKLQKARAAKRVAEAWDISNTMRANGCPPGMLRGLKVHRRKVRKPVKRGMKCLSGVEMREWMRLRSRLHRLKEGTKPYIRIVRRLRFLKTHRLCF